jgi:hypothetical protein
LYYFSVENNNLYKNAVNGKYFCEKLKPINLSKNKKILEYKLNNSNIKILQYLYYTKGILLEIKFTDIIKFYKSNTRKKEEYYRLKFKDSIPYKWYLSCGKHNKSLIKLGFYCSGNYHIKYSWLKYDIKSNDALQYYYWYICDKSFRCKSINDSLYNYSKVRPFFRKNYPCVSKY